MLLDDEDDEGVAGVAGVADWSVEGEAGVAGVAGVARRLLPLELCDDDGEPDELLSFEPLRELDELLLLDPLSELDELLLLDPLSDVEPLVLLSVVEDVEPVVEPESVRSVVTSVRVVLLEPGDTSVVLVLVTPQSFTQTRTDGSNCDRNCSSVQVLASPPIVTPDSTCAPLTHRWMQDCTGVSKREMKVCVAGLTVVVVVDEVVEPVTFDEPLRVLDWFVLLEPERLLELDALLEPERLLELAALLDPDCVLELLVEPMLLDGEVLDEPDGDVVEEALGVEVADDVLGEEVVDDELGVEVVDDELADGWFLLLLVDCAKALPTASAMTDVRMKAGDVVLMDHSCEDPNSDPASQFACRELSRANAAQTRARRQVSLAPLKGLPASMHPRSSRRRAGGSRSAHTSHLRRFGHIAPHGALGPTSWSSRRA